ncbi:MAG TPA: DUF2726 domain-containing protein [Firmicutes bacterium]|nr:DUF2726 domain-containing protein [Bacillota bacterium]
MKKRIFVWILLGGAAAAALSFLLAGIDSEGVQNFRWALFAFGLLVAVAATAVLVFTGRRGEKRRLLPEGAEYRRKKSMMTAPELKLYRSLRSMLRPERYAVLPQAALVTLVDKVSGGGYRSELFRVADFCIADAVTFEPLLVIELNDASHLREERKLRDDKVAAICDDAGLPLLTLTLAEADDERCVRDQLKRRLRA